MRIAYVYPESINNLSSWSGLPWFIREALRKTGVEIITIDNLNTKIPISVRLIGKFYQHFGREYFSHAMHPLTLKMQAKGLESTLAQLGKFDWIIGASTWPLSGLSSKYKLACWHDSTIRQCFGFYPERNNLASISKKHWIKADGEAVMSCSAISYSSEWAANDAISSYGADPRRVNVIPFGANLDSPFGDENDAKTAVEQRSESTCKLLFVGRDWNRKGGQKVLEVFNVLRSSGNPVELTIIGCNPFGNSVPEGVICMGPLDPNVPESRAVLHSIFSQSHFFMMLSEAECFGIVYAEASAHAVPSLAHDVGGVSSAITNNKNGWLFPLDTPSESLAATVWTVFLDKALYAQRAMDSYRDYKERLNWEVNGKLFVKTLIEAPLR